MQTTLRVDDGLYREVKAQAVRDGVTVTQFLEEGLRLRLRKGSPKSRRKHRFRVYQGPLPGPCTDEAIRRVAEEEQERYDLTRLGATRPHS